MLVANWGIPLAAFADAQANPEKISGKMTSGNVTLSHDIFYCLSSHDTCVVCISSILLSTLEPLSRAAPCGLQSCKNRPTPFPDRR